MTASYTTLTVTLEVASLMDANACKDSLLAKVRQVDPSAEMLQTDVVLTLDARPVRRGKTLRASNQLLDEPEQKKVLAELVRTSHRKLKELNASPLHPENHEQMTAPTNEWTRKRIAIGLLAPDIQKALLTGTAPRGLDPELLLSQDIPLEWEEQRKLLGFSEAH